MKMCVKILFALLVLWQNAQGQNFVNLDFEDAIIIHDPANPPNGVYANDAIPGWVATGYLGPNDVLYNTASAGSTSVSILDTNGHPPALDGNYSVLLYGGLTAVSASISQIGIVPVAAQSIVFKAQNLGGVLGGPLFVSMDGQNISFFALSTEANYTLYGGNIPPAFGGQSVNLIFSAPQDGGNNAWNIDDIQFSSTAVPEPGQFAIGALGALLLGFRRWRKFA